MSLSVACQTLEDNHSASTILAKTIHDLERAVQNVFECRNLIGNFMQAAKPFRAVALYEFLHVFEEYYLRSCWRKVVDTLYLVLDRANDAIKGYSAYSLRFGPDPRWDSSINDSLAYQHFNVLSWRHLNNDEYDAWWRVRF